MLIQNFISANECESIIRTLPSQLSLIKQEESAKFGIWYKNNITNQRIAIPPLHDLVEKIKKNLNQSDNYYVEKMYVTKYDQGEHCIPHTDPTDVTAIILLNEDFDGGHFFLNRRKIKISLGDLLIFDGCQPHGVTKIEKGIRYSLSIWFNKQ